MDKGNCGNCGEEFAAWEFEDSEDPPPGMSRSGPLCRPCWDKEAALWKPPTEGGSERERKEGQASYRYHPHRR